MFISQLSFWKGGGRTPSASKKGYWVRLESEGWRQIRLRLFDEPAFRFVLTNKSSIVNVSSCAMLRSSVSTIDQEQNAQFGRGKVSIGVPLV